LKELFLIKYGTGQNSTSSCIDRLTGIVPTPVQNSKCSSFIETQWFPSLCRHQISMEHNLKAVIMSQVLLFFYVIKVTSIILI